MERTTKGLWNMLCQLVLPLWKLNSENKHSKPGSCPEPIPPNADTARAIEGLVRILSQVEITQEEMKILRRK
eukprot:12890469-Prorocentrum_lima.AAC.1